MALPIKKGDWGEKCEKPFIHSIFVWQICCLDNFPCVEICHVAISKLKWSFFWRQSRHMRMLMTPPTSPSCSINYSLAPASLPHLPLSLEDGACTDLHKAANGDANKVFSLLWRHSKSVASNPMKSKLIPRASDGDK